MSRLRVAAMLVVISSSGLAACSKDDGASVRECPSTSESQSASETAVASGSQSAADCEADSGSGSAVALCDPFGNQADATTTVNASVDEFAITADPASAPAGTVHFAIENRGDESHEFIVVRADSIDALPLDDEGALDEGALGDDALIGEVPAFPASETCDGTFELAAGNYVLVCNRTESHDGEEVVHLAEGMALVFTVT